MIMAACDIILMKTTARNYLLLFGPLLCVSLSYKTYSYAGAHTQEQENRLQTPKTQGSWGGPLALAVDPSLSLSLAPSHNLLSAVFSRVPQGQ